MGGVDTSGDAGDQESRTGGAAGGRITFRAVQAPEWVFGYGSLIWRPTFRFEERRPGWVDGWARRFWQGSTDHRGVPGAPGRVVTLVAAPGSRCAGVAYRLPDAERESILAHLDHREKGGYARHVVDVHVAGDPPPRTLHALVFIATEANPEYLGPATVPEIAEQIRRSHGPSGPNAEYALRLAEALRAMQAHDEHVFTVAEALGLASPAAHG
jgi:cation transport regulator ChaC